MSYKQALFRGGLTLTSAFALCAITADQSQAGILTFTNQADFLNAIQPGFYLNNFASLPDFGFVSSPTVFSNGTFSYTASATDGLYGVSPNGDRALSTADLSTNIVFDNFAPTITAIGGYFFGTDFDGDPTSVTVTASVNGGSALLEATTASATNFFGFVSDDGSPILSLTLSIDSEYATVDDLIVGQAVPEPLTLLGASAAVAFGAAFKRRKVQ